MSLRLELHQLIDKIYERWDHNGAWEEHFRQSYKGDAAVEKRAKALPNKKPCRFPSQSRVAIFWGEHNVYTC